MDPKTPEQKAMTPRRPASEAAREARLKAALKANMARRKAQAKARTVAGSDVDKGDAEAGPDKSE